MEGSSGTLGYVEVQAVVTAAPAFADYRTAIQDLGGNPVAGQGGCSRQPGRARPDHDQPHRTPPAQITTGAPRRITSGAFLAARDHVPYLTERGRRTAVDGASWTKDVAMPAPPLDLDLRPMEAEGVDELPSGLGWQFDPKYDGFRCLAHRREESVHLQSKRQKPLERYFP